MHESDDISIMARLFVHGFKDSDLVKTRKIAEAIGETLAWDFKNGDYSITIEKVKIQYFDIVTDVKIYLTGDNTADADLAEVEDMAEFLFGMLYSPIARIYMNRVLVDFCD
jgi:flavodoxin